LPRVEDFSQRLERRRRKLGQLLLAELQLGLHLRVLKERQMVRRSPLPFAARREWLLANGQARQHREKDEKGCARAGAHGYLRLETGLRRCRLGTTMERALYDPRPEGTMQEPIRQENSELDQPTLSIKMRSCCACRALLCAILRCAASLSKLPDLFL